jgi:uncharacterized membrane protein YeaQ/YmgE (transglycosylase-associated protein family)
VVSVIGWIIVIVGALVLGVAAQALVRTMNLPYRWIVSSIAAFVGAVGASEFLFPSATPQFEGMAVWPAIVGALVVGAIVDLIAVWYARSREHGGQGHGAAVH